MTAGYVYFIQRGTDGPVKIGFSANPRIRIEHFQAASGDKIHCLCICPGSHQVEHALHKEFERHRIAREWFNPAPEILERAVELTQPLISSDPRDISTPISKDHEWLLRKANEHSDRDGAALTGLTPAAFRKIKSGKSVISFRGLTNWCRADKSFAREYAEVVLGLILPDSEIGEAFAEVVNAAVRARA